MVRLAVTEKRRGQLGYPLLLTCLFGLAVLFGHQLVMASPQHAGAMSMALERAMPIAIVAPADVRNSRTTPGDQRSPTGWQDCFSQQGLLPALLLLLTLAGFWRQLARAALMDMISRVVERVAHSLRPPPLNPSRRQALLQVFLN